MIPGAIPRTELLRRQSEARDAIAHVESLRGKPLTESERARFSARIVFAEPRELVPVANTAKAEHAQNLRILRSQGKATGSLAELATLTYSETPRMRLSDLYGRFFNRLERMGDRALFFVVFGCALSAGCLIVLATHPWK